MTAKSPEAFLGSVALHAIAIALVFFSARFVTRPSAELPRFELVRGEGDFFDALAAPRGAEASRGTTAEPRSVESSALTHSLRTAIDRAERKARREISEERTAEALHEQPAEAPTAKPAQPRPRVSKQEFDRKQGGATRRTAPAVTGSPRLDPAAIRQGVLDGVKDDAPGGARGTVLSRAQRDLAEEYLAELFARFQRELDHGPFGDGLAVECEFHVLPDGRLAAGRIISTSGDPDYDRAVLNAVRVVRMNAPRPPGVAEVQSVPFRTVR
jgi:TonB family protein